MKRSLRAFPILLASITHVVASRADGGYPSGGLVLSNGKAFGMTEDGGGSNNNGLVFEIVP